MKKILAWIESHLNILFLLLFLSLIPLYIIQINLFNANSLSIIKIITDIIVAFAAVASAYLFYLAFKESRLANQLKKSEVRLQFCKDKIYDYKIESKKPLFKNEEIKTLVNLLPLESEELASCCYEDFFIILHELVEGFKSLKFYNEILTELDSTEYHYPSITNRELIQLMKALDIYEDFINKILDNFYNVFSIISDINWSHIDKEQRFELIKEINDNIGDYILLGYGLKNGKGILKKIREFELFNYESESRISKSKINFDSYIDMFNKVYDIFDTYQGINLK